MPVGITTASDAAEKKPNDICGKPVVNMWWTHSPNDKKPVPTAESTIHEYPTIGRRATVGTIMDAMAIEGRKTMYTSGCPKIQNKCCQRIGSPPRVGSKNGQSNERSSSNRKSPAISGGNAKRIIPPTTITYQAYRGMMLTRIPGGRHFNAPTINSTAAAILATSMNDRPSNQMSGPMPSSFVASGGYMNHPALGAASNSSDPSTKHPPIRKHQYPYALRRGNGISLAPRKAGRSKMLMASNIGTAKRNIMAEPCMVKNWLNRSASKKVLSGKASCTRIANANNPAISIKVSAVSEYHVPTSLLLTADQ